MRDPDNLHKLYEYIQEPEKVFDASEVPVYDEPDWDLFDEKELKKFVDHIKRLYIRGSFEYRQMVKFLRENMDMDQCLYFANVTNANSNAIKIEIHHDPFDLYSITMTVINKRSAFGESLSEEDIALEVMYLHYTLLVGLIPVSSTEHALVHNQYLFIPLDNVLGNHAEFVERYRPWIPPECLEIYDKIKNLAYDCSEDYKTLLSRQFVYVTMGNQDDISKDDIMREIKGRISDLLDSNNNPNDNMVYQQQNFQSPAESELITPIIFD